MWSGGGLPDRTGANGACQLWTVLGVRSGHGLRSVIWGMKIRTSGGTSWGTLANAATQLALVWRIV